MNVNAILLLFNIFRNWQHNQFSINICPSSYLFSNLFLFPICIIELYYILSVFSNRSYLAICILPAYLFVSSLFFFFCSSFLPACVSANLLVYLYVYCFFCSFIFFLSSSPSSSLSPFTLLSLYPFPLTFFLFTLLQLKQQAPSLEKTYQTNKQKTWTLWSKPLFLGRKTKA